MRHLKPKLIDLVRVFRARSFCVAAPRSDEYATRVQQFASSDRYRHELIPLLDQLQGCRQLLDFGCGTGEAMRLAQHWLGCHCTGIDVNPHCVAAIPALPGLASRLYSGQNIPYPDQSFDAALVIHALAHVPDPVQAIAEIHRVLQPGGKVGIITPNPWYSLAMLPANLVNCYEPDLTILQYFDRRRLRRILEDSGFRVDCIDYVGECPAWIQQKWLKSRLMAIATR